VVVVVESYARLGPVEKEGWRWRGFSERRTSASAELNAKDLSQRVRVHFPVGHSKQHRHERRTGGEVHEVVVSCGGFGFWVVC
jgi:hypothetical protein